MRAATRPGLGLAGLLAAQSLALLGTGMTFIVLPWLAMGSGGNATAMGLVTMAELLPYVLVLGLGGPLVDRLGHWRTSVASDLAAAAALAVVPLAAAAGRFSLPVLAASVAAAGALRGAGDVARQVLLPRAAGAAAMPLERAAGLFDGAGRLAGLVGAPIAGAMIAATSAPAALAAVAACFLVSAIAVALLVERMEQAIGSGPRRSYLKELGEGLAFIGRDRLLLGIVAMLVATNLLDQAYGSVLLPIWAKENLGSPLALGTVAAVAGCGSVAGNALLAWLGPRLPRRPTFALSFLAAGAPRFLVLALSPRLAPVLAVAAVSGLGAGGLNPPLSAVEYERVPPALRARVLGTIKALAWAGMPFGGLLGGRLADSLGLRAALAACGAAYLTATLAPFAFPSWKGMEREAAVR